MAIVGGSSSRATRLTTSGLPPDSPSVSFHSSDRSSGLSTTTVGVENAGPNTDPKPAPVRTTLTPSIVAAARSRLALAVTTTELPLTTASTPPRASFVSGSSRPR